MCQTLFAQFVFCFFGANPVELITFYESKARGIYGDSRKTLFAQLENFLFHLGIWRSESLQAGDLVDSEGRFHRAWIMTSYQVIGASSTWLLGMLV